MPGQQLTGDTGHQGKQGVVISAFRCGEWVGHRKASLGYLANFEASLGYTEHLSHRGLREGVSKTENRKVSGGIQDAQTGRLGLQVQGQPQLYPHTHTH